MLIYDEHMAEWPASGVLVSRRHVLTAAVNVHNYNRWDLGFGSETARNLYVIKSFNAYVHEQFNDTTNDNNIALIVMPEPVRTSGEFWTVFQSVSSFQHSGSFDFSDSTNCTDCIATATRAHSTRRWNWSHCRLYVDQCRWQIIASTQSRSTTDHQWGRLQSRLSSCERIHQSFFLWQWRPLQCLRWHPRQWIDRQTKRRISFGRHCVVRQYMAWLWSSYSTRFHSCRRIRRLDSTENKWNRIRCPSIVKWENQYDWLCRVNDIMIETNCVPINQHAAPTNICRTFSLLTLRESTTLIHIPHSLSSQECISPKRNNICVQIHQKIPFHFEENQLVLSSSH